MATKVTCITTMLTTQCYRRSRWDTIYWCLDANTVQFTGSSFVQGIMRILDGSDNVQYKASSSVQKKKKATVTSVTLENDPSGWIWGLWRKDVFPNSEIIRRKATTTNCIEWIFYFSYTDTHKVQQSCPERLQRRNNFKCHRSHGASGYVDEDAGATWITNASFIIQLER